MPEATTVPVTVLKQAVTQAGHGACLVHIYPLGPDLGSRFALGDASLVLGREEGCEIPIQDSSVSRQHARIQKGPNGYQVVDLDSTNGTFVNYLRVTESLLEDGDYLGIGNCLYRFLSSGNVESQYHEEIYRLSMIDGLTGIPNQRYFLEFLDRELPRSARHHRPLALILLDIDRFKEVNDRLGHLGGDATLRQLVACVRAGVRKEDLFARYGGEEFAVVLPETPPEAAAHLAERLRERVEAHPFQYEGQRYHVTVSLGVAATPGRDELPAQAFIRQADLCLYQAKRAGRNRVALEGSSPGPGREDKEKALGFSATPRASEKDRGADFAPLFPGNSPC